MHIVGDSLDLGQGKFLIIEDGDILRLVGCEFALQIADPLEEFLFQFRAVLLELFLEPTLFLLNTGQFVRLVRLGDIEGRSPLVQLEAGIFLDVGPGVVAAIPVVGTFLVDIGEKGFHGVEILGGEGVELVIVALGAAHRCPEEGHRGRADAFGIVLGDIFRVLDSALFRDLVDPVESGRYVVLGGGILKEIPGQLFDDEGVVGLVAVEGADDIVPVGGHAPRLVTVVAVTVGVAGQVEPHHRHTFAVVG